MVCERAERASHGILCFVDQSTPYVDFLQTLAKHYDFNPRLLGLMCSNPVGVSQKSTISSKLSLRASHVKASIRDSILNISGSSHGSKKSSCRESTSPDSSINIEDGLKIEDLAGTHEPDMTRTLNQYALASDIWHYSTMDWGRQCKVFQFLTCNIEAEIL